MVIWIYQKKKRCTNPRAILHLRLKGVKVATMRPGDFKSQKIDIHQPVDELKNHKTIWFTCNMSLHGLFSRS